MTVLNFNLSDYLSLIGYEVAIKEYFGLEPFGSDDSTFASV